MTAQENLHLRVHGENIASGFCPAVSPDQAWCNRYAGHPGAHMAFGLGPDPVRTWEGSIGCSCVA